MTDDGPVAIEVPRDRAGTFAIVLVPKHARRLAGSDDKVPALYARGLPTREIQKFLEEIYRIEVSPTLISQVTDDVVAEVTAWQARPLEPIPKTTLQTCLVHLIRRRLDLVGWRDRSPAHGASAVP